MAPFDETVSQLQSEIVELNTRLSQVDWSGLARTDFISEGARLRARLRALDELMVNAEHFAELVASETASEFRDHKLSLRAFEEKLARNVALEEDKSPPEGAVIFGEKESFNANFSSLQHEIRTILLQLSYVGEKARLDSRRLESPLLLRPSVSKSLLSLLREKESELQSARSQQVEWQKKALLGGASGRQLADLENEFAQSFAQVKNAQQRIEFEFGAHEEFSQKLFDHSAQLKHQLQSLQESVASLTERHTELVTVLKKEAAFAKSLAFSVEQETVALRGRYTSEILDVNERIVHAREEEAKKSEERIRLLEKDVHKKSELLTHFKSVVEGKEKSLSSLQDELSKLKVLLSAYGRHDRIRASLHTAAARHKKHQSHVLADE